MSTCAGMLILAEVGDKCPPAISAFQQGIYLGTILLAIAPLRWWVALLPILLVVRETWYSIEMYFDPYMAACVIGELGYGYWVGQFAGKVLPVVLPLGIILFLYYEQFIRARRLRSSQCVRCGYDLTGNVSGTCPECGTGISDNQSGELHLVPRLTMPVSRISYVFLLSVFLVLSGMVTTQGTYYGTTTDEYAMGLSDVWLLTVTILCFLAEVLLCVLLLRAVKWAFASRLLFFGINGDFTAFVVLAWSVYGNKYCARELYQGWLAMIVVAIMITIITECNARKLVRPSSGLTTEDGLDSIALAKPVADTD